MKENEIAVAFYFICPKCRTIFRGEPYKIMEFPKDAYRRYPTVCPNCDVRLMAEVNQHKPLGEVI